MKKLLNSVESTHSDVKSYLREIVEQMERGEWEEIEAVVLLVRGDSGFITICSAGPDAADLLRESAALKRENA